VEHVPLGCRGLDQAKEPLAQCNDQQTLISPTVWQILLLRRRGILTLALIYLTVSLFLSPMNAMKKSSEGDVDEDDLPFTRNHAIKT